MRKALLIIFVLLFAKSAYADRVWSPFSVAQDVATAVTITGKSITVTNFYGEQICDETGSTNCIDLSVGIDDDNVAWGTETDEVSAADIPVAEIAGATYDQLQEMVNLLASAGRIAGGTISDAGSETVNVTAGQGWIKATDSDVAEILAFDWALSNGIAIPTDSVRYIGVKYGTPPVVDIRTTDNYDLDTEFTLGKVVNEGGTLHILNDPWWVGDIKTNVLERNRASGHFMRDAHVGGLVVSVPGTRNIKVTAGTLWSWINEFPITEVDTSSSGDFEYYYYNGSAWVEADNVTYSVANYNNIASGLVSMTNNWYSNLWVYVEADDDEVATVAGQGQYLKSAAAEAEAPPTLIPDHISESGILIGRILFREGVDAPVEVQTVWETVFTAAQAADHNNLSSLQGGTSAEYYHLTSAEYGFAQTESGWRDYISSTYRTQADSYSASTIDATINNLSLTGVLRTISRTGNWSPAISDTYNTIIEMASGTLTLPAIQDSVTLGKTQIFNVIAGGNTVIIDVDGSDIIRIGGVDLDPGDTIDSNGKFGCEASFIGNSDQLHWMVTEPSPTWTDGGGY